MQSLLKRFTESHTVDHTFKEFDLYIDLTKLDNTSLKKICDHSKMTHQDILNAFSDNLCDLDIFYIFQKCNPSLADLQVMEIEKFSESLKQKILGYMLIKNMDTDKICVLLDKMKSVNYGDSCHYGFSDKYEDNNPLFHCCFTNKMDLVKLLVEKYYANMDYISDHSSKTAIIIAAERMNEEIIKYLYSKGAKYPICAEPSYLGKLIDRWEKEKLLSQQQTIQAIKQDNENELRENYKKIKLELKNMHHAYENILNLLDRNKM